MSELSFARQAIWQLAVLGGKDTELAMRYVGLFKTPDKQKLSFERILALLNELTEIKRNTSTSAWQAAIGELLQSVESVDDNAALIALLNQHQAQAPPTFRQPETPKVMPLSEAQKEARTADCQHLLANLRIKKYQGQQNG